MFYVFFVGPFSSYTFFALNQQVLSSHVFSLSCLHQVTPRNVFFGFWRFFHEFTAWNQAVKGTKGAGKSKGTKGRGAPPNKGAVSVQSSKRPTQKPPSFQPRIWYSAVIHSFIPCLGSGMLADKKSHFTEIQCMFLGTSSVKKMNKKEPFFSF